MRVVYMMRSLRLPRMPHTELGFHTVGIIEDQLHQPWSSSANFPIEDITLRRMRIRRRADNPTLQIVPIVIRPTEVRLLRRLGSGFFGAAYLCRVRETDLVVKVPLAIENARRLNAFLPAEAPIIEDDSDFSHFERELLNAEHLLEPRFRQRREDFSIEQAETRFNIMQRMRAHPGYKHIHRIVHGEVDAARVPYPMLFSEPCEGTLEDRLQRRATWDYYRWRTLAVQLWLAFDYMRARGLYHLDLKADNIFFIGERYMVADFGFCGSEPHHRERCARSIAKVLHTAMPRARVPAHIQDMLVVALNADLPFDAWHPRLYREFEIYPHIASYQSPDPFGDQEEY